MKAIYLLFAIIVLALNAITVADGQRGRFPASAPISLNVDLTVGGVAYGFSGTGGLHAHTLGHSL
jgi:hypothetical protein